MRRLRKMASHRVGKEQKKTWGELVDMDFVYYLTREIVLLNPIVDCRMKGRKEDWRDLPHDKSLFNSEEGCGLPIGNLTSQLFSNVYLGELDDYMKRELGCKHYGRYVDDFYVVSASKEWLRSLVDRVKSFLREHLGLTLHDGKLKVLNVRLGVEFLGAYLKPWRRYVSNSCLKRMTRKIKVLNKSVEIYDAARHEETFLRLRSSLNSFLGVLSHYKSKTLRTRLMYSMPCFFYYGGFDGDVMKYDCFYNDDSSLKD